MFGFMQTKGFRDYVHIAEAILDDNWTGSYTKPAPGLYPHQWNWDSAFIAIGYARYNQSRAQQEMLSLFEHQWPEGMVPQIVFNPDALGHYFPEPDFWQTPNDLLTSGITMPPLHAVACLEIYKHAGDQEEARDFLRHMFPKLKAAHRYFYRYRDPEGSGLVHIRHPWESGLDNSPAWDGPLDAIHVNRDELPPYERKDLDHGVPADQRPSDRYYDCYVFLVDLFRRLQYREEDIFDHSPFLVQDVLFNAILCRANHDLLETAEILKQDDPEIKEWVETTARAISEDLWCPVCERFESFDLKARDHLHTATAAGFMPLFAGAASTSQSEILYDQIDSVSFCALHQGNCFTIPNYDMTKGDFDSRNYWRGPVWININWMMSQGLVAYGYKEKADSMKRDMIQLPIRFGFHEYFDSQNGKGYGSPNFSWTASLFIHLVHEYYDQDRVRFNWLRPWQGRKLKETLILSHNEEPSKPVSGKVDTVLMAAVKDLKNEFYETRRGLVDYEAMKASGTYKQYKEMTGYLRPFDPGTLKTPEEKKAFWINLYNTLVVHGIVELGIKRSVWEVSNFFSHIAYRVGGMDFSPDDIEHGMLRANARPPYRLLPVFKWGDARRDLSLAKIDPRIHFALVCGSRSCAPIHFYEADSIDRQLDKAAHNFINSSEVIITPEENKIFLSQIFNWYEKDFGGRDGVIQYLLQYLEEEDKARFVETNAGTIQREYLFYDWNLNH